jgi:hypothetical protein
MKNQQAYSSGLLYSVAPGDFPTLHLHDEDGLDEFDWGANESQLAGDPFIQIALNFLKLKFAKR